MKPVKSSRSQHVTFGALVSRRMCNGYRGVDTATHPPSNLLRPDG
jgi:hypothetical protein